MATRLPIPTLPQIDASRLRAIPLDVSRDLKARWPENRAEWKLAIWQLVFLPWWLWSDNPAPRLPERDLPLPAGGLAGEHVKAQLRSIARRAWLQRAMNVLARTLWLTILVAVVCQGVEILGGPKIVYSAIPWVGVALLIPALLLAICFRPSNSQVARMLDRSFELQERTITALANIGHDLPFDGQRAGIRYLQVADAANALTMIRGNSAFRPMPPVRELVVAIICGLAFASLFFLRGGEGEIPPLQPVSVPEFIPAAQQFVSAPDPSLPGSPLGQSALSPEELQALAEQSGNARQDLLTLAGAMEDHAFTRSAANSLNQGDYQQAVQTLNSIADQAGGLSESERESLAADLDSAAASMSESGENLAGAASEAADGLREGGSTAQEGIEGVADAVQETAQQIASNDSLDQAMQSQQSQSTAESSEGNAGEGSQQQSLFDQETFAPEGSSGSQSEDAQPGESDSAADNASGSNSSEQSDGAEQGDGRTGQTGSGSQDGGTEAMPPSEDVMAGGETPYDDPALMERPPVTGDSMDSTSGDGAGTDSAGEVGPPGASSAGADSEELPDPSDPEMGNGGSGSADDEGAEESGGTVTLNRMPNGEAVPVQGAGSQSNLGSGAGMTSGGGGSAQGEVGQSGPDSNHVPSEYRSIVESYFSVGDE